MHHVKSLGGVPKGFTGTMKYMGRKQLPDLKGWSCHMKIHGGVDDGLRLSEFARGRAALTEK